MRTITLELLRHGPAHNQLLSPLTPYIALCENHGAVTIHVPFEHNQFLHRLDAIRYRLDDESRQFQLKDTAAVLGEMIAAVPGLTAEANKQGAGDEQITHLRLIISASELALLPFELALSPAGMPGAGQQLLLQSQMPVCLTREVRRAPDDGLSWPDRAPRILFAAAAPPDVGEVPLEPHLLALRRAIQPWVKYYDANDTETLSKRISEHFVFLPEASIEAIEEQCASGTFTHVHILAHGIKITNGHDTRYVLALHDARNRDKTDPVGGARLATALRASERPGGHSLARPAVVTLASCDSGNLGSVAGAGVSIAHALHEAGVAMVVAGQFPLSFAGSVRLVEVIYDGLLWGRDPRHLIYDLRRRLYSQFSSTHDWASLTAYLSLPRDFEYQLSKVQINQAMGSINAAMSHADEAIRRYSERIKRKRSTRQQSQESTSSDDLREDVRARMHSARRQLEDLVTRIPKQGGKIRGLLASTAKRQGEVLYRASLSGQAPYEMSLYDESNKLLMSARDYYWESFISDRTYHWAVVQYLSLRLVIQHTKPLREQNDNPADLDTRPEKSAKGLWTLARMLSLYDLHRGSSETRSWAHGNLIELYLLSLLPELGDLLPANDAQRLAFEHVDQLVDIAGRGSFEVFSTRRQMLRYLEWYGPLTEPHLGLLTGLAEQIFDRFPSEVEERF
jgi:hypothetical protein